MEMFKIYPKEKFQLETNLNKRQIIERFEQNVLINDSYIFRKQYTQKPNNKYEGIIIGNEFKIQHKHIYGENGSWRPVIFGIINDHSIELEFRIPSISFFIIALFIFLSIITSIVSIYFIVTENRFEWIMLLPFVFLLIIFPASLKGYKKERVKAKADLKNLFQ
ncbi:hypothetical protein Aeqsu_2470 [Aequorivita sublithincola DSM 14238]|uniref:Uncharacterized protein n=1 Tax=Aequorivita sublithincola (strain DSM 14238 / LMG 21431 / ACAM 643 / 9-3) TaxID=746697 RepID=I3YY59_AEQSU|nr:hypothetical protein [Aequorivita sublithincola]AFL81927.1 hypothetical protein Aeqsu_2470 [Aequorivita sublithincola DSM 14238]